MAYRHRLAHRVLACAVATLLALAWMGCGDDDNKNTTTKTNAEKFDEGVQSLANFGSEVGSSSDALIVAQVIDVLGQLFPGSVKMAGQVALAPDLTTAAQRLAGIVPRLVHGQQPITKAGLSDNFGVYQCDPEDVTEPFPGWALTEETPNPENSIIFRFDETCGFMFYDEQGNAHQAVGELRMTDVESVPDPNDETLDLPTQFDFEMWVAPAGQAIVPVMRVTFVATWDETGAPTSITVGSPTANSPSNPDASYLGALVFYAGIDVGDTDSSLAVQLYDSSGHYAIRVAANLTGDLVADDISAVNLMFGFGHTQNPAAPPFVFDVTASNFDPETGVADIAGSISLNGEDLAVFAGDTSEVPVNVDTNGDEVIDEFDTCPNIQMTFTDDPESTANICENIDQLFDLLGGIVGSLAVLSLH